MSSPMCCLYLTLDEKTWPAHTDGRRCRLTGPSRSEWEGLTYKQAVKWQKKDVYLWQMLQHSWSETKMGLCKQWLRMMCYSFVGRRTNIPPLLLLHIFWGSGSLPLLQKHQRKQKMVCSCSRICTTHVDFVPTQQLVFGSHHTTGSPQTSGRASRLILDDNWWTQQHFDIDVFIQPGNTNPPFSPLSLWSGKVHYSFICECWTDHWHFSASMIYINRRICKFSETVLPVSKIHSAVIMVWSARVEMLCARVCETQKQRESVS